MKNKRSPAGAMFIPQKQKRFILILCLFLFFFNFLEWAQAAEDIKEPNVAGLFYPRDPGQLEELLARYRSASGSAVLKDDPIVLVSPHAGYVYSGPVAAYGYQAISGKSFDAIIILGPSHYFSFSGVAVWRRGAYRSPLGDVQIDEQVADMLLSGSSGLAIEKNDLFSKEHSIETQIPFLQDVLPKGFRIVPVLFGGVSFEDCQRLAKALVLASRGRRVLLVASTDLSHYRELGEAINLDGMTIDLIKEMNARGLWREVGESGWNVCGAKPLVTAMLYAQLQGAQEVLVFKYGNSADASGDKSRVVGYLSAAILPSKTQFQKEGVMLQEAAGGLTGEDKSFLLRVARGSIEAQVLRQEKPEFGVLSKGAMLRRGAFVTIHRKGELRGCVGLFTSQEPLYETVAKMGRLASAEDDRFPPVTKDELKDIDIEISVLTEPVLVDDWRKIRLGVDGVIIRRGASSGVFLPQVATETGWSLEEFLSELCFQKAGLARDSYRDPATKIYIFQAEIFGEK